MEPPASSSSPAAPEPLVVAAATAAAAAPAALPSLPPPPAPSTKGRGKRLTDRQRMDIIARLEDKVAPLSRAECARRYGVSPAAIGKLMKMRASVKKRYADAGADAGALRDRRQRGGFAKNAGFEDELFRWICSIRARRIPLLVAHVQQKAKLLAAKHHGLEGFKASNGWYYRFCARYGLVPGALHSSGGGSAETRVCSGPHPAGMLAAANVDGDGSDGGPPDPDAHGRRKSANGTPEENEEDDGHTGEDEDEDENDGEEEDGDGIGAGVGRNGGGVVKFGRSIDWRDDPAMTEKVVHLQDTVKQFDPEFVYSLSEARLFYRLLPNILLPAFLDNSGSGRGSDMHDSPRSAGGAKGDMERVMVLVCANATGTHKLPLLVVGKQSRPSCFGSLSDGRQESFLEMQVGKTKYFSQRDVWCDNQTFQYWCTDVFAPAVQARTTRPVLLLLDNPAGSLEAFNHANISTYFLPTRAGSLGASLQHQDSSIKFAQFQPLQHGVIRELKRRYKVSLFHEALSLLEIGNDERFRLLQRSLKRPHAAPGLAFGRVPHVGDAMELLEEAWSAIPAGLLRAGWLRSELFADGIPGPRGADADDHVVDISDDTIVLELCAMLRQIKSMEEVQGLPKEMQLWIIADDDSSERMQQELLHDVQKLLQEEEDKNTNARYKQQQLQQLQQQTSVSTAAINHGVMHASQQVIEPFEHPGSSFSNLMHSALQQQQQQQRQRQRQHQQQNSHAVYPPDLSDSTATMGYGFPHHHADQQLQLHQQQQQQHFGGRQLGHPPPPPPPSSHHQLQQNHHQQIPQPQHNNAAVLRDQRKAVSIALRALADAEEALDSADVRGHFGDDVTSEAIAAVGTLLRRLRRVQRGKQSALPVRAPVAAAGTQPPSAQGVSVSTHAFFYDPR